MFMFPVAGMLTIKIDNEGVVTAPFPHTSMYKLWSKGLLTLSNPWRAAENPIMAPFDQSVNYLCLACLINHDFLKQHGRHFCSTLF